MYKILILLVCTSCTYKFVDSKPQTVSIQYISGDETGDLTSSVVAEIEKLPSFRYTPEGGAYTLEVRLLDEESEKIDYRFQHHEHVAAFKKVIPSEGRAQALVEVKLLQNQKCVLGPAYILGSCEFAHQNESLNTNINRFSLGQLTDIDTTEDVLYVPLYRNTARKVALWLQDNLDLIYATN